MENLRILSLGRNLIKKIENLDAVADTLEELWISYNQIASLVRHRQRTIRRGGGCAKRVAWEGTGVGMVTRRRDAVP